MKKILLLSFILFSGMLLAQKGGYSDTGLNFGSNFSKGKSAMTNIEMINNFGYEFSEKFRLGVAFPIGFMFLRGENEYNVVEKFRLFTLGFGLNGNFRFYNDTRFALRGNISLMGISADYSNNPSDWFFLKSVTSIELYPHSMATAKIKPYCAIGLNSYYSLREFSDKTEKEYSYFAPFIGIGVISKF